MIVDSLTVEYGPLSGLPDRGPVWSAQTTVPQGGVLFHPGLAEEDAEGAAAWARGLGRQFYILGTSTIAHHLAVTRAATHGEPRPPLPEPVLARADGHPELMLCGHWEDRWWHDRNMLVCWPCLAAVQLIQFPDWVVG